MDAVFRFKQFAVRQSNTAMKVGTDGVLLGAWVDASKKSHILDIGAGTGVISLMLAQRYQDASITALEIDENACKDLNFNIAESPWNNNIAVINKNVIEYTPKNKFDCIVSNPPYFEVGTTIANNARATARYTAHLNAYQLLEKTNNLLSEVGEASFIIPYQNESTFIEIAALNQLYPKKITRVQGNNKAPVKRSLITFSRIKSTAVLDSLVIEITRHNYTDEYVQLVKPFYLKL